MTKLLLMLFFHLQPDFTDFTNFVGMHFRPSESVKRYCPWQYAIVKIKTNSNNIITGYQVENKVSDELIKNLSFLTGYHFKNNATAKKHNIVFFISLENKRTDACEVPPVNTHEDLKMVFKKYKLLHVKEKPANIYVDQIVYSLIEDPVH